MKHIIIITVSVLTLAVVLVILAKVNKLLPNTPNTPILQQKYPWTTEEECVNDCLSVAPQRTDEIIKGCQRVCKRGYEIRII